MNIKELETMLGISRSNIRFYEKQGLFQPRRKENNYRDYSPEDVTALKEIMVYRKMGFTVEEVALILKRQLPYREGMSAVQNRLEEEISRLEGSLRLLKELSSDHSSFEEIDPCACWEIIKRREESGEVFQELLKEYLHFDKRIWMTKWMKISILSILTSILLFAVFQTVHFSNAVASCLVGIPALFGGACLITESVRIFSKESKSHKNFDKVLMLFPDFVFAGAVIIFVALIIILGKSLP